MTHVWIGIALLASSWMLGLDYYHAANWPAWAVMVSLGSLLMIGLVRKPVNQRSAIISICLLAPGLLLAPWPYRVGLLLLVLGLIADAFGGSSRWRGRIGGAAKASGLILLAQSLTMLAYTNLTARGHDLPRPLTHLLAGIAKLLGMNATVDGTNIAIFTMRQLQPLGATWELLVDPPSLCFLVGGVVTILLTRRSAAQCVRAITGLLVSITLWLPLRAGLLMAILTHRVLQTEYEQPLDLMNQFWSAWVHLLLLAIPVLLAWRFVSAPTAAHGTADSPGSSSKWKPVLSGALCFAAVAAITTAAVWDPVGERKEGRILVDEYHSQLAWPGKTFDTTRTDRPFDTDWYGRDSAYNFASIYDFCTRFYEMSRLTGPVDELVLLEHDVLMLKVPSARYSRSEIAAIKRFVERGGGLLLIGEHTAVYGSGVSLNEVAGVFGFAFRDDCLFGIDSWFDQQYTPPLVPHPIVAHMPPLDFATSCSIDPGTSPGRAVICSTGLKNLRADYHATNAYPQTENRAQMRYGAFVQLWTTRYGAGRVAAFTDSTIFANFAAFESGKSELMLGMLEWLNHRNRSGSPKLLLTLLGLVLLGITLSLGSWGDRWLPIMAAGVLGWSVSAVCIRAGHMAAMPQPEPVLPMVRVGFDRTICDARLPKNGFIGGKKNEFGQFERSILRVGYFPFRESASGTNWGKALLVGSTLSATGPSLFDADIVILLHPNLKVNDEYRKRAVKYVESGGKLLVLDSPANTKSTANEMLDVFGLKVESSKPLKGQLAAPGFPSIPVESASVIRGGVKLASLEGETVAAVARHGAGSVTVIGFGSRFTDAKMGVVGDVVPDDDLREVFEFEFALLRAIESGDLPGATSREQRASRKQSGTSAQR